MERRVAGRADDVGEKLLRAAVAVQNVVLAALFKIKHKLHGNARAARPLCVRRLAGVARHIARVVGSKVPEGSLGCCLHADSTS